MNLKGLSLKCFSEVKCLGWGFSGRLIFTFALILLFVLFWALLGTLRADQQQQQLW